MRATEALLPCLRLGSRCSRYLRHIKKGGFDTFDEDLRLARPRHALHPLILRTLLHGRCKRDHRHICPLRRSLAHGAEEGFAYALVQSGGEEQKVRTLKQLVCDSYGVGSDRGGAVAVALKEGAEGAPDHRVCAEDCYCGCGLLAVVLHLWGGSFSWRNLLLGLRPYGREGRGFMPRPPRGCGVVLFLLTLRELEVSDQLRLLVHSGHRQAVAGVRS